MKKILIVISNYGKNQIDFCKKQLIEFSKIKNYDLTIKIFSSNKNDFDNYEEIIIENYTKNDFSLGIYDFLRKNELTIKENFDYILFTENDMIFNQTNFDTYFKYESTIEKDDYTIGFLRYEIKNDEKYLIDLHYDFSVDLEKKEGIIDFINNDSMFSLQNPHQGCFMIKTILFYKTLPKITIGKSLEDKVSKIFYSTNNIGSNNGIKKYIPVKDIESLLIFHQPNKYVKIFSKITKLNNLTNIKNETFL